MIPATPALLHGYRGPLLIGMGNRIPALVWESDETNALVTERHRRAEWWPIATMSLDLEIPAVQDHLLRWVAEKMTGEPSIGCPMLVRIPRAVGFAPHWILHSVQRPLAFSFVDEELFAAMSLSESKNAFMEPAMAAINDRPTFIAALVKWAQDRSTP